MTLLRGMSEILLVLGAVPLLYLGLLSLASLFPARRRAGRSLRVAVLIPAHNEASIIGNILDDLGNQRRSPELVLVVAHNCSDRTAEIARERGAHVLPLATGSEKADALAAGFAWLESREWDAVLILDADCRIPEDFLFEARGKSDEIVQSRYLLDESSPQTGLMYSFLARLEDALFHIGRERLGCIAFLRGTGMFLGREALAHCPWAARGLTEDRNQTYAFLSAGVPIRLDPRLRVLAAPPSGVTESWNQRRRWLSTSLPQHLLEATRTAWRAARTLGLRAWELPLAVWVDARAQWMVLLILGVVLAVLSGARYAWALALLSLALVLSLLLGTIWYRRHFLRVLLEAPRSAAIIFGATILTLTGRRPSAWKRGR